MPYESETLDIGGTSKEPLLSVGDISDNTLTEAPYNPERHWISAQSALTASLLTVLAVTVIMGVWVIAHLLATGRDPASVREFVQAAMAGEIGLLGASIIAKERR